MAAIRNIVVCVVLTVTLFADQGMSYYCGPSKYACRYEQKCISQTALCDGVKDCSGGDDEVDCVSGTRPSHSCHSYNWGSSPIYVKCSNTMLTSCCSDAYRHGFQSCCSKSTQTSTIRSVSDSYRPRAWTSKPTTYTSCLVKELMWWDMCTNYRSTQCCPSGFCCSTSTRSTMESNPIECRYKNKWSYTSKTQKCLSNYYDTPSCCNALGSTGQTCCEGSSSTTFSWPTEYSYSFTPSTTDDYDNIDNGDTGSYNGLGQGAVFGGVGGSVGFIVLLSIICVVIRGARMGMRLNRLASDSPTPENRRTCGGILVIRTRTRLICPGGEGPLDDPESAATAAGQPPAYADVIDGADNAAGPSPPTYDEAVNRVDLASGREQINHTDNVPLIEV